MRVIAFTKYGSLAASTRQRFMQYESALGEADIQVDYAPLLKNDHLERLAAGKRSSMLSVSRSYAERVLKLLAAGRYDALWVHCELFPYLPGFTERLAMLWRKPIVFDYDDAIFHMYDNASSPLIRSLLGEKLAPLLRSASVCCCGNAYLRIYAEKYCEHCIFLPTVVDTAVYAPMAKAAGSGPLVIGWIGSPSTWCNVRPLLPVLARLCRNYPVRFRVIGAGAEAERDRFPGLELAGWSEAREVAEVRAMDIGLMPLLDRPFQRGKSGFKLIQYMACGLPVAASPVGANRDIVMDGRTGILASSEPEWESALSRLIDDSDLRQRMGAAGRARAVADYSLATHAPRLVEVFKSVARGLAR